VYFENSITLLVSLNLPFSVVSNVGFCMHLYGVGYMATPHFLSGIYVYNDFWCRVSYDDLAVVFSGN